MTKPFSSSLSLVHGKKIEPRLSFYSQKRCMYCGSNELTVDYDADQYVTLFCRKCKHQDHYFTK